MDGEYFERLEFSNTDSISNNIAIIASNDVVITMPRFQATMPIV